MDHMLVQSLWTPSMVDYRAFNGTQIGNVHGSGNAMVRARLRLRVEATSLSSSPVKLNIAKFTTTAVENIHLELRNRFKGIKLNEGASPADESQELKDVASEASYVHIERNTSGRGPWQSKHTYQEVNLCPTWGGKQKENN